MACRSLIPTGGLKSKTLLALGNGLPHKRDMHGLISTPYQDATGFENGFVDCSMLKPMTPYIRWGHGISFASACLDRNSRAFASAKASTDRRRPSSILLCVVPDPIR